MTEEFKDSGTVTALFVIGLVFGLIGMLGSFIPCMGHNEEPAFIKSKETNKVAGYYLNPREIIEGFTMLGESNSIEFSEGLIGVNKILTGNVSPDGKYYAAIAWEKDYRNLSLILCDTKKREIKKIGLGKEKYHLIFSPDSKEIFVIFPSHIAVFESANGNKRRDIQINSSILNSIRIETLLLAVSLDGKIIVIGHIGLVGYTNLLEIFNLETGEKIRGLELELQRTFSSICLSPDNKYFAVLSVDYEGGPPASFFIELYDIESAQRTKSFPAKLGWNCEQPSICFISDLKSMCVLSWYRGKLGNDYRSFTIYDIETGLKTASWQHNKNRAAISLTQDGTPYFTSEVNMTRFMYDSPDYFYLSLLTAQFEVPTKEELETKEEYMRKATSLIRKFEELLKEARIHFKGKNIPVRFPAYLGNYSADSEVFDGKFLGKKIIIKSPRELASKLIESRNANSEFYIDGYIKIADEITDEITFQLINISFVDPNSDIRIKIAT